MITCATTSVCPGDEVALHADGCTGTVIWSTGSTGTSVLVTPTVSTTYTAQCKVGNCLGKPSKPIIIKVSNPQPPTITADSYTICAGGSVTLTAAGCEGKVIWSTGVTGNVIVVSPESPTTYYANCRILNCLSGPSQKVTIHSGPLPIPQISVSDEEICPGEKSVLTISNCSGIPQWSTGQTTASIDVSPSQTTSYTVVCRQGTCISPVSAARTVTVSKPQPPSVDISADTVCLGNQVQLTAMGCSGTVLWSNNLQGSSISVAPTANTTYRAYCKIGSCQSELSQPVSVVVVNPAAPIIKASRTLICAGEAVQLTALGCEGGTIVWSNNMQGSLITVMPGNTTTYTASCKVHNCLSSVSNALVVNVSNSNAPVPTLTASATAVCKGEPVTLTAAGCGAGTVVWSTGATGNSLVVSPTSSTEYHAACRMNEQCNGNPAKVTVLVNTPPKPTIRVCKCTEGRICLGDEIRLTVEGCTGSPLWSNGATTGSIVVSPSMTTIYSVVCRSEQCSSDPSESYTVVVGTPVPPVVTTSKTEITPGEAVVLSATGCVGGQIIWSTGATGTSITVNPTATTSYFAQCKIHGCLSDPATVVIKVKGDCPGTAPRVSASDPLVCYGGSVTLTATGCSGGTVLWSNGMTGTSLVLTNITAHKPYTAVCRQSEECRSEASDPVSVSVITMYAPTIAASKPVICPGETTELTAVGCPGTVVWSTGATGTSIVVQPVATTDYWATCNKGGCVSDKSPLNTVKVSSPASPTISATSGTVCFGASVTLTASGCDGGYVVWSNNQVGPQLIISPATSATYTATCCNSASCKSGKSNEVVVKVYPKVKPPVALNISNVCPFATADLNRAVGGSVSTTSGVVEFYNGTTPDPAAKVATPGSVPAGTYYVFEKTINGCFSQPGKVVVTISNCNQVPLCTTSPASVTAGSDALICAAKDYKLNGVIGGAATSAVWTSSGTGVFDNPGLLNATYKPSTADIQAGSVTLTLTTNDPDGAGSCKPAFASLKLTIQGISVKPTVSFDKTVLCHGDSIVLTAQPEGYKYLWNTQATGRSLLVKTGGAYSVQLVDGKGCTSLSSDPVSITVSGPIESPVAPMMARNTCPGHTVDLTELIESSPVTAGGRFEFRTGDKPASPIVIRPDSVGRGVFYAFERSLSGCYSAPTMIDVSVFDCNTDTCRTDMYVKVTADNLRPKVGETVTFTVKLGNKGRCAATHSDIRIILPSGLELVSPGNLVVDAHGHLGAWITILPENDEVSFHYKARLLTKGPISSLVEITYLDQVDPDLSNNKATVVIQDSTVAKAMVLGMAKALKGVEQKEETLYEFSYEINVTNYSDRDARRVQVNDDVQSVFDPHVIESVQVMPEHPALIRVNSAYTGRVGHSQLLDTASVVKAGTTERIVLKVQVRLHPDGSLTKTFMNQAYLVAKLDTLTLEDQSTNGKKADPDNDGNPNNNSEPTPARFDSPPASQIGVALAVAGVEQRVDSSYNVTYQVTVKNYGNTPLKNVQLSDSLIAAFHTPTQFTVVSPPSVGTNSTLKPNAGYDGHGVAALLDSTVSSLPVGAQDTVRITVNIKPNGKMGPFYTQVVGEGKYGDTLVTDLSNNGFNPHPVGSIPTGLRFDLPPSLLGVAKAVEKLEDLGNGAYQITYRIRLKNMGGDELRKVKVIDDLGKAFGQEVLIGPGKPKITADAGLTVDTTYTGQGMLTNLLVDSLSTLPGGTSRNITLTVRVDVRNSRTRRFDNTAVAGALLQGGAMVADTSTAGSNPDPDNDLDPRNNSVPTMVTLPGLSAEPKIGAALAVRDTTLQPDGTYKVGYQVIVRNYSGIDLTSVQLQKRLSEVFNTTSGASFTVTHPIRVSAGTQLLVNEQFDGEAQPGLLKSGSKLPAGRSDTLLVEVRVRTDGRSAPYLSRVYATALAGSDTVTDLSTDGFNPDINGNNDPTEEFEKVPTPLLLKGSAEELIIPEGFSPNGDHINDQFVIRNTGGAKVILEVFNRWGHAVYRSEDYRNDWDGTTNTGLRVGSASKGVPDGTYFYVIRLSDGRRFIRFMTINR
ncbi:T9SS type B sorting domain-containing protein [Larkinella soli]|uniref:T9SS type B sorting domain-containing protein n=1 Tax=Larkinella soli TaxID=1770527 RepID=UPI000FFCA6B9|nr:gliding motility-associated C-terminal domain-containing protein [Larkinella soli]